MFRYNKKFTKLSCLFPFQKKKGKKLDLVKQDAALRQKQIDSRIFSETHAFVCPTTQKKHFSISVCPYVRPWT